MANNYVTQFLFYCIDNVFAFPLFQITLTVKIQDRFTILFMNLGAAQPLFPKTKFGKLLLFASFSLLCLI